MSEDKEYDVVLDTLQKQRDILWKMTQSNMNIDMFNIMDQIRLEHIDQLDKAMKLWSAREAIREVIRISEAKRVEDLTLEDLLVELLNYGRPRIGVYGSDGTWHCSVEMNTNTVGADFKCASDFNQPNPTAAAKQCLERVYKAVEQYRK